MGLAWAWPWREDNAWRRAIFAVLLPAGVAFVLLLLTQFVLWCFVIHTAYRPSDSALTYEDLNSLDLGLLNVHRRLDGYEHLASLRWLLLILLVPLAWIPTRLALVSWALRLRRTLTFVVSVASLVTSFSFITDKAVSGNLTHELIDEIRITYDINHSAAGVDIAQGLSARAVSMAIASAPPQALTALVHLSQFGENFAREHRTAARADVFESLTGCYLGFHWREALFDDGRTASSENSAQTPPPPPDLRFDADPAEALRASQKAAETASSFRKHEQQKAIEAVLNAAAGAVPKKLTGFALDWIGKMMETEHFVLASLAKSLVEEARDAAFERRIEPAVRSAAEALRTHLNRRWEAVSDFARIEPILERQTTQYVTAATEERERAIHDYVEALKRMGLTEESLHGRRTEFKGRP